LTICATGVGFAPIPRCIADQWGLGVCFHRNLSTHRWPEKIGQVSRAKTGKKQPPCSCGRTTICAGYRGEVDTIRDTLQLISCSRGFGSIVEACLHQQVRRQRRA
jgi:hypothetical protein